VEWISGQWRRASDRILIFRLGRAGAGRGGVGRDASADRIPPVPRADGTARRPRGVAWRDGRGVGTETRLRRGVGEADADADHGEIHIANERSAPGSGGFCWVVALAGRRHRGALDCSGLGKSVGACAEPTPSACGRRERVPSFFHGNQRAARGRQAGGRAPAVQLRLVATSIHGTRRPTPTSLSVSTCPRLVALSSVRGSGEARHLSSSLFLPLAWPRARSLDRLPCKATRLRCNLHKRSGFTRSILSLLRQAVDYSVRDGNQLPPGTRWTGCCRAPSAVLEQSRSWSWVVVQ
jgi:hypothetical protein